MALAALLLAAGGPCGAQQRPAEAAATRPSIQPDKQKPLPARQLEEALRLLLKADSAGLKPRRLGLESQGLVMDQTISKLGRDFYELFFSAFEPPAGVEDFTVVLLERQARANNPVVALVVNDTELVELPLAPRADMMEESALAAAGIALDFLLQAQSISRQLESGRRLPPEVY